MKRKIISMLLAVCMVCSMLPMPISAADSIAPTSTVDAFGIRTNGELTTSEYEAEKANNPYGTTEWMNLFPVSELHIAYGNSDGRKFLSYDYNPNFDDEDLDDRTGEIKAVTSGSTIGKKEEGNGNDGFRILDTAPCDPLGEGQDTYIANLAYWKGGNKIELFLTDKNGNRVSETKGFGNEATLEYLEKVEGYNNNGLLSVACGDFDGDGFDSVAVYLPYMKDSKARVEHWNITKSGSQFKFTSGETVVGNIYQVTGYSDKTDQSTRLSSILRDTPQVQLLAEDTDKDGFDELIMTASRSNAGNENKRGSVLCVFDYMNDGNENFDFQTTAKMDLGKDGMTGAGRLRWASSSVGNVITNSGGMADFPEIVSAGYYDYEDNDDTGISDDVKSEPHEGNLAFYMTACTNVTTDDHGNQTGSYTFAAQNITIDASEFVRGGLYTGDDMQSLVPVQAFSARGAGYGDYVLVADTVYAYEKEELNYVYRADYFNDDDDGIGASIISNGLVQDVTAGNFDGNSFGAEQVVFSTVQKRQGRNDYYSRVFTYQAKASAYENGPVDDEDDWTVSNTGWLSNCIGYAYLSLTAFDCDTDGTIVKFNDVCRTYTEPEVLAILESVPYFAEVDEGDTNNGTTSYSTLDSESESTTFEKSLSTNVVMGFEWSVDDVCAGFVCGAGFEATVENNYTWATQEENYSSYSLTYHNDSGDNMVIVYRRPVITYRYEEKYNGKMHTISKEGALASSMISVDEYNEIAAQRGMDTIAESVLGIPGDPFSYRSTAPDGAVTSKNGDVQQYNGSGTVEQSFTTGSSTADSFIQEMNTSFTAYGMAFGVKAGGGMGGGTSTETSTMNTSEVTKTGAVSGKTTEGYDFQWQFAHWKTDVNGNTVPVLGYIITDPIAPPSPPTNLSSDDLTSTSFVLDWDATGRPADEYRIYRDFSDVNKEPVLISTVAGTKTSCVIDHLSPNSTYSYIIKSFSAAGEGIHCYGLSVASDKLVITTLAEDAPAPTIVGPFDTEVKAGGTATFAVDVTLPSVYRSVNYVWQQRTGNSSWSPVSPSQTGEKLVLTNVQAEQSGTEYRCEVSPLTFDGTPTFYYSDPVQLKVGSMSVTADLTMPDATGGDGSINTPYAGQADYPERTRIDYTDVIQEVAVTIPTDGVIPELDVYEAFEWKTKVEGETEVPYEDFLGQYVGIGEVAGSPVYYEVTNVGAGTALASYEVGDPLTLSDYVYKDVAGNEYTEMTASTDDQINTTDENGKSYYLVADVPGTSRAPIPGGTDSRLDTMEEPTFYWFNGKAYFAYDGTDTVGTEAEIVLENAYDVYLNGQNEMVLGRSETYSVSVPGELDVLEDETDYWFYHVKLADDVYTVKCITQERLQQLENGVTLSNLKSVTAESTVTVETPVYETQDGTSLTLKAMIEDTLGNVAPDATVDFYAVNTATGASQNITAVTDGSGMASASWRAPSTGLYRICATVQRMGDYAGTDSAPLYYFAGATPIIPGDTITEYHMELSNLAGILAGEMGYVPDTDVIIGLQSRTVDGDDTSEWTAQTKGIVYTVTSPDGTSAQVDDKTFTPQRAGLFSISAYEGAVAAENLLTTATLRVNRALITLEPYWNPTITPETISDIIPIEQGDESSDFSHVFDVDCDYYDAQGLQTEKSGRFTVSLTYKGYDEMVEFNNCYQVTLEKKDLLVKANSASVYYSAGENGTIEGRYSQHLSILPNGYAVDKDEKVQFEATPNPGYQVDQWIINDQVMDAEKLDDLGYVLSGNILKIPALDVTTPTLNVVVTFGSANNKIIYSRDGEGTISAVTGADAALVSGTSVALGADVIFTAEPGEGKVVGEWKVNGETYTWAGTNEPYRGNSVKLEEIRENYTVTVSFVDGESHAVTTLVYGEDGTAAPALATIDVVNADGGEAVDLTQVPVGTALTFTADLASSANNTVKEWQYKEDGQTSFLTVAGSGGQNSITLYNLSADMEVRAIVTTAQTFDLNFSIEENGGVYTGNLATLTATSKGNPVLVGKQAAYIPVDFTLVLDDSYYVVEWTNNVTANGADLLEASLDTLLSTTGAIQVTIAKKPTVTFTGDTNMVVTASGVTQSGDFVDYDSDGITFAATPKTGYEVDTWTVDGTVITGTANADNDTTTYTSGKVTDDIEVKVTSKAISQFDVSYAVVDTKNTTDGGDGFNGQVALEASRKAIADYAVTGDAATNETAVVETLYRDSKVTLTATPDAGYRVKHWLVGGVVYQENGATHKGTELTFEKLSEAKTVQVEFEKITDLTNITAVNGTIVSAKVAGTDVEPTGIKLSNGATVVIVAEADEGYKFKHWAVNGNVQSEPGLTFSYTSTSNSSGSDIVAIFESDSYVLTYSAGENGTISTTVGASGTLVKDGTSVTFTATPETNYGVKCWNVDGIAQTETANEFTCIITKATEVTVAFERTHYIVSFDQSSMSAKVDGVSIASGAAVEKGSDVVFTAIVNDGDIVQSWTENGVTDGGTATNPCEDGTYTSSGLDADTTVSVTTMAMPNYSITYSAGEKGSVALAGNEASPATVVRHDEVTLSATPDAYYQVDAWVIDGTEVTAENAAALGVAVTGANGVSTLTVADVTGDMVISVSFKEAVRYNVKFSTDTALAEGTVSAISDGESIQYTGTSGIDLIGGSKLIFTAVPTGSMVAHWMINGEKVEGNLSNTLELDLEKSVDVVVGFEPYVGYTIPVSRADYDISEVVRTPDDTQPATEIRKGGTLSFKVTPTADFQYASLIVCGFDCVAGEGDFSSYADKVEAVKNEDGSYTVTITGVKAAIDTAVEAHRIEVSDGLPAGIPGTELDTAEAIKTKLNVSLTGVSSDDIAYFDVELKYWNSTDNRWDTVTPANFPAGGVEVLLPYPTGTTSSNVFTIVHMFTSTTGTNNPGDTEVIEDYTKTDDGLLFRVDSLSPFAVGWKTSTPGGGGGGGGLGGGTEEIPEPVIKFIDVETTDWFHDYVYDVVDKGLFKGTSEITFSPYDNTTRAMVWTVFARMAEVDLTGGETYYSKARIWAMEEDVSDGTFPDDFITREQFVTMLWRFEGRPMVAKYDGLDVFADVDEISSYAELAMAWAHKNGIIQGKNEDTLDPQGDLTRAEMAAILSRFTDENS